MSIRISIPFSFFIILFTPVVSFAEGSPTYSYQDISSCVLEQSSRYDVAPDLIWKVIRVESDGVTTALNRKGRSFMKLTREKAQAKIDYYIDRDLSIDVGLMQINTYYLRRDIEITSSDMKLLLDPCFNIAMGAFILSKRIYSMGENWDAIGSYNVGVSGMKGKRGSDLQVIGRNYIKLVQEAIGSPRAVRTPVL